MAEKTEKTACLVNYLGMSGVGPTPTQARHQAAGLIEQALTGSYDPQIINYRNNAALVYRTPLYGWCWKLIQISGILETGLLMGIGNPTDSLDQAIAEARMEVAKLGWRSSDPTTAPSFILDIGQRHEFQAWATGQVRYREARAKGYGHIEAKLYAENPDMLLGEILTAERLEDGD